MLPVSGLNLLRPPLEAIQMFPDLSWTALSTKFDISPLLEL